MRAFAIAILFLDAGFGLYIGYELAPAAMAIRYDIQYYEYTPPPGYSEALYRYYYFLIGVVVSVMTLAASRVLRLPDIAALSVIFVASFFFRPLVHMFVYGESLSYLTLLDILWFQPPYFAGMFAVLGVVYILRSMVFPLFGRGDT